MLTRKEWKIVGAVALAVFMARLDTYIVNISLPSMASYFGVGIGIVSFVLLAYMLVVTSTMLLFGKIGDEVGQRTIFLGGFIVFTAASLLCGLAPRVSFLIFARCLQALGGAMLGTAAFALVKDLVPRERLGAAFGILSTLAAIGVSLGPPLGGIINGLLSWHWIFLVNVPVGALAIFFAYRWIPATLTDTCGSKKGGFDYLGSLSSFLGLFALVYALSQGDDHGWLSPIIIGCILFGAGMLALFVWRERHYASPLLNLRIFASPRFAWPVFAGGFAYLYSAGNFFILPFYLQGVGCTVEQSGLIIAIAPLTSVCMAPLAGVWAKYFNQRVVCATVAAIASSINLFFALALGPTQLWPVVVFLFVHGLCYGVFAPTNNSIVMGAAPAAMAGQASGVFQTIINLGLAMGVCSFEFVYRMNLPMHTFVNLTPDNANTLAPVLVHATKVVYFFGTAIWGLVLIGTMMGIRGDKG